MSDEADLYPEMTPEGAPDPGLDPNAPAVPPVVMFTGMDDNLEVEVSDEVEDPDADLPESLRGKSKAEIAAQLKAERERAEDLRRQADATVAMKESIESLGDKIGAPARAPAQAPVQQPGESEEEFKKRLDEGVYDRGIYDTMTEFNTKKLAPLFNRILSNTMYFSRRDLERDPERGDTYKRYREEIDAEISRIPDEVKINNPNLYVEAHDKVMMQHKNEVIADEVQKQVQAELKRRGLDPEGKPVIQAATPAARVPFSESGVNPPVRGPAKPRKVRLNSTEEQHAFDRGMSKENYAAWKVRRPEQQKAHLDDFKRRRGL